MEKHKSCGLTQKEAMTKLHQQQLERGINKYSELNDSRVTILRQCSGMLLFTLMDFGRKDHAIKHKGREINILGLKSTW